MQYNDTLFFGMYPEFKNEDVKLLRMQWNVASRYTEQHAAFLPGLNTSSFMSLIAHMVKLNIMAQVGHHVDGYSPAILQPPTDPVKFRAWLDQTKYGRSVG